MQEQAARSAPASEAIAIATLSDPGRVRAENQDAVALIPNTSGERLLIVADGMGGHRGGETASKLALRTIERVFREPHGTPEQRLIRGLELANEEVYSHALANPELRGMGTTAVVALLAPQNRAWVAWVGDSRLYRLRDGTLERLTKDHSLMAEWIGMGVISEEAAKTHPRRHELTRALGQAPDVSIDLQPVELAAGDRFLLCSDGLHGCVSDYAIGRALAGGQPDAAACALVDGANAMGGPDNVSVIVAVVNALEEVLAEPAPEPVAPTGFDTEPTVPLPEATASAPVPEEITAPMPEEVAPPVPEEITAPMPEEVREPVAEPIAEPVAEPPALEVVAEAKPEEIAEPASDPDPITETPLEFVREPIAASEPEPAPPLVAPEPAPEPALDACAPEIAAELGVLAPNETFSEPSQPNLAQLPEANAEISFADLGRDLMDDSPSEVAPEPAAAAEPVREPAAEPSLEFAAPAPTPREAYPTPSEPIQIPRMTPLRRRRGLDATSLAVGVTTTLLVLGLGFALWSYTVARRTPESAALDPAPKIVRTAPARPAPAPKPSEPPVARPEPPRPARPAPAPTTTAAPVVAPPAPAPATLAKPVPAPPAPVPPALAPPARAPQGPPNAPAAPATPLVEQDFSLASFELPPEVEHFLGDWLDALAADDRPRLGALGFPNEPSTLAGRAGHRDGFRLAAAEIDEGRSHGGRVYLRVIVSYAFTDANGRFRTQDEQRLILDHAGGRLRFAGRWQQ